MSRKRPIEGMSALGSDHARVPDSVARPSCEVPHALALVVVGCESAPDRIGEVLLPGIEPAWFGRTTEDDPEPRSSVPASTQLPSVVRILVSAVTRQPLKA